MIIASDGVFEFLTNQQVAGMISKFSDPQEACKKVVVVSVHVVSIVVVIIASAPQFTAFMYMHACTLLLYRRRHTIFGYSMKLEQTT